MASLARLRPHETVLLVVDVQEKILPVMLDAERVVRNCALLVECAHALEIPIVVTEQYPQGLGATVAPLRAALGEVQPIAKEQFSAFVPQVREHLEALQRPTVLLCGVEGHICVMQTALDLVEAGYAVFGAFDAISSRQAGSRQAGWERMRLCGVVPSSSESAVFELLGTSRHPQFKSLAELVK